MRRSAPEILTLLEHNAEAIRRLGVRRLGLFGSSARGTADDQSDLDFVVEFERKSFDANLLGCRIDLVVAEAIKPRLRETILAEALHAPGL